MFVQNSAVVSYLYTPQNQRTSPKKGAISEGNESSSKAPFSGDHLVFAGEVKHIYPPGPRIPVTTLQENYSTPRYRTHPRQSPGNANYERNPG